LTRRLVSGNLPFVVTDGSSAAALAALGDRTRRELVDRLAAGPMSVRELADTVAVTRPAVSQHLRVLKDAGLVSERAEGTRRIYRLEPAALAALRDQLDAFWRQALLGYGSAVDAAADDRRST
jgi:DNA-binding transcriptional ArsR family regulator